MSVIKLRKTHTEEQLDGESKIAFSLPDGVNYLSLLGALTTTQDWVLAEMRDL